MTDEQNATEQTPPHTHVEQPLPADKTQTAKDYVEDQTKVVEAPQLQVPEDSPAL